MPKIMITIRAPSAPPTLADVRERYQLGEDEIDQDFGVVEVDQLDRRYAILIDERAAPRIVPSGDWEISGPFANLPSQP